MQNEAEIKKMMAEELAKGTSLSDIQKLVNEKFGLKMTYMDVRIMAAGLESVDWSSRDPKPAPAPEETKADDAAADNGDAIDSGAEEDVVDGEPEGEAAPGGGSTVVEISKLVRPGAALSGSVTFASGVTADWFVDQMGRMGLDKVNGGKPTENDIREFQTELNRQIEKLYGGR